MSTNILSEIQKLEKIDLHRHVEGATTAKTLSHLHFKSTGKHLPVSYFEDLLTLKHHTGALDEFLKRLATPYLKKYIQSTEDLLFIFNEAVADAAADGLTYMEIRFALSNFLGLDQNPATLIQKIRAKLDQASDQYGCTTKLIITIKRDDPMEVSNFVLEKIIPLHKSAHFVGLDLAGNEHFHPNEKFTGLAQRINNSEIPLVIHAGEAAGPESVRSAITLLNATRISHGVRAVEDESVMALIRDKNILLEVCPTSNIDTGLYQSYEDVPIKKLIDNQIPFLICTDDPVTSGITLSEEISNLINLGILSLKEYQQQLKDATHHTFSNRVSTQTLVSQTL